MQINQRPKETLSNFRLTTARLGSGWAAVLLVDVKEPFRDKYTDVQQTGIGRYATKEEADEEARQWAEAEEVPFNA